MLKNKRKIIFQFVCNDCKEINRKMSEMEIKATMLNICFLVFVLSFFFIHILAIMTVNNHFFPFSSTYWILVEFFFPNGRSLLFPKISIWIVNKTPYYSVKRNSPVFSFWPLFFLFNGISTFTGYLLPKPSW